MAHLRTHAVHAGQHLDAASGAIATPITQTTAFGYGTLKHGAALFAGAVAVAHFLAQHPAVRVVHYLGLASHPQHALAQRLLRGGFRGMGLLRWCATSAQRRRPC